jgi:hypothetical protein
MPPTLGCKGWRRPASGSPASAAPRTLWAARPASPTLLGQRERTPAQPADTEDISRFSLLREAAAAVAARGGAPSTCQVADPQGQPCPPCADVRLADPAGSTIWAYIGHAEDVLVTVPGAFGQRKMPTASAAFSPGVTRRQPPTANLLV